MSLWSRCCRALRKRTDSIHRLPRVALPISGVLRAETAKAYLVDCGGREVWLPKSHILQLERDNPERGDTLEFLITDWLYRTKFGSLGGGPDFWLEFTDVHE